MTWATDKRYDYIAERLSTAGRVRRADLINTFGISRAQASVDLRNYQRRWPGNIRYDSSLKSYVPAGSPRADLTPTPGPAPRPQRGDLWRAAPEWAPYTNERKVISVGEITLHFGDPATGNVYVIFWPGWHRWVEEYEARPLGQETDI